MVLRRFFVFAFQLDGSRRARRPERRRLTAQRRRDGLSETLDTAVHVAVTANNTLVTTSHILPCT